VPTHGEDAESLDKSRS